MDEDSFREGFSKLKGSNKFNFELYSDVKGEVVLRGSSNVTACCKGNIRAYQLSPGIELRLDETESFPLGISNVRFPTRDLTGTYVTANVDDDTIYNFVINNGDNTLEINITIKNKK